MIPSVKNVNELLDDITICALLMNDSIGYEEYIDCIPEALHSIYRISVLLGVKLRYSTVKIVLNYTKSLNDLNEFDIEEITTLLKELINNSNNITRINRIAQEISRIAIGREINIFQNSADSIELSLAALYAVFLSALNNMKNHIQEIPIISTLQPSIETITV